MLGRIKFENYEKCYPSRLRRLFQSDINYNNYNAFVPQVKHAIVGNLPPEIIRLFPKETRAERIKSFQQALGSTAEYLRETYRKMERDRDFKLLDENYRPSQYVVGLAQKADRKLNMQLAEISGGGQFNARIKYAGHGGFGNVYQLSLIDSEGNKLMHDKALKVFHNLQENNFEYKTSHNNYAEANFWTFLKRALGHSLDNSQFTKHYMSDMKNGYSLTEFIDPKIHQTTSPVNICHLLHLLPPIDSKYNMPIMGKQYDIGGYEKAYNFTADKVVLRYFKKLIHRSQKELPRVLGKIEALAQNPKTPHRDKIQQALKLFKQYKRINNQIL